MGSEDIVSDIETTPVEVGDSKPIDKVSKELAAIRKRRNTDSKNGFLQQLKIGHYLPA